MNKWMHKIVDGVRTGHSKDMDQNIIFNPNFKLDLKGWQSNCCVAQVSSSSSLRHINTGKNLTEGQLVCFVTQRTESWQGLEQELTPRLKVDVKYKVTLTVQISNATSADVGATLRLETSGVQTQYLSIGKVNASCSGWSKIQGYFRLNTIPEKAIFYIEGPPPGVDILVAYVDVRPCALAEADHPSVITQMEKCMISSEVEDNVLQNSDFEQGLEFWYGKCCTILLLDSSTVGNSGVSKHIALVANRTSGWQGIEQDITGRIKGKKKYEVSALVRIRGEMASAEVLATLWIKDENTKEQYITLGRISASSTEWAELKGCVLLNQTPAKATAYIEGPPAGIDLLVDHFSIVCPKKPTPIRPVVEDPNFGVNVVENSGFLNGLNGWSPLGPCFLSVNSGAPLVLPKAAADSLGFCMPLTGLYVTARNRKHNWEGPSQNLSGKLKLYVTYQISAWVRIGHGGVGPQKVNVALGVEGEWVNGGEIEGDPAIWREIGGSFRFEKGPGNVLLYVQGPSANVDLMVSNLIIFAVDRAARFETLRARTDKVQKRDAMIQIRNRKGQLLSQATVTVQQKQNTFPLGSCINSYSTDNEAYVDFFFKNFNWAVFENELKWYWTEKERNQLNYKEADELCELCIRHGVRMRGHCIFWETDDAVQNWVKELDPSTLSTCVQNRIIDLVSRFRGKFDHYDVNNEMLHGSFFKSRLGAEIIPYMFQLTHQLDPETKLFVNDYHVVDGCDAHSSPEKYILQIQELQAMGAPVGGIGVQGHIKHPIGAIISNALDKLAVTGLPIWFTEVDVESPNEFLRGDDLEVVLREAYAHPAVEGFMLWGFMDSAIHRKGAHLVDPDGTVNEAGKVLLALKQEWQTRAEGTADETGCFCFRGYHGIYTVTVVDPQGKRYTQDFELSNSDDLLIVDVCI